MHYRSFCMVRRKSASNEPYIVRIQGTRLTTEEACRTLNVTRMTLRRWTDSGKIKCEKSKTTGRLYYTIISETPNSLLNAVNAKQACAILGIKRTRLYELCTKERIHPLRNHKPWMFVIEDLDEYRKSTIMPADSDLIPILSVPEMLEKVNRIGL